MTNDARDPLSEAARRIVTAAESLFAERGFDGVSIRDIAQAAGVSKANVFHHFANKLELYQAVLDCSAQQLGDLLAELHPERGNVENTLARFTGEHLAGMLEQAHAAGLFLRQMLEPRPSADAELAHNVLEQRFEMVKASLATLRGLGKLRADVDPTVLAMVLLGSNVAYFLRDRTAPAAADELPSPDAFGRAVLTMLTEGILPHSPTGENNNR